MTSSSSSSSLAISCSMPASSARISVAPANPPPNRPCSPGRRTASRSRRAVGTAGWPGGSGPPGRSGPAAGSRGRPARRARRAAPRRARTGSSRDAPLASRPSARTSRPAPESNAWYAAAPRIAKITCWIVGDWAQLLAHRFHRHERGLVEREAADARPEGRERDARHVVLAGPGERAPNGRVDDRAARPAVAVERDGVDHELGGEGAGRRDDRPPIGTGAWRTAANSIESPPARLIAPPTPVAIHSDRLAAFTMASTSRSQISPFQSSIRARNPPRK